MLTYPLFLLCHPLWRLVDLLMPKKPSFWAFATHHLHTGRFIENQRALFEAVKGEPGIRKIVFYRGPPPDLEIDAAVNYEVVRHGSLRGLWLLAQCKVIFLTHSVSMDYSLRWDHRRFSVLKISMRNRLVVNLWHGIPLKRLLYTANDATFRHTDRVKYRTKERRGYAGLLASSDIDSYAMAAMFYPLNYRQIWVTGLPRNDFLTMADSQLPRYIRKSIDAIRNIRKGRRLVVYAPTYRQTSVSKSARYYQFSRNEIKSLKHLLEHYGAILGYRPHYFRNSETYFNLEQYIDNNLIYDMSQGVIPEFSALARECEILATDYSSVYIEALYLGKPVICFGYDIEHYRKEEDGLLYSMDLAFPGPVAETFDGFLNALEVLLKADDSDFRNARSVASEIFFKYRDDRNSERVKNAVMSELSRNR